MRAPAREQCIHDEALADLPVLKLEDKNSRTFEYFLNRASAATGRARRNSGSVGGSRLSTTCVEDPAVACLVHYTNTRVKPWR